MCRHLEPNTYAKITANAYSNRPCCRCPFWLCLRGHPLCISHLLVLKIVLARFWLPPGPLALRPSKYFELASTTQCLLPKPQNQIPLTGCCVHLACRPCSLLLRSWARASVRRQVKIKWGSGLSLFEHLKP